MCVCAHSCSCMPCACTRVLRVCAQPCAHSHTNVHTRSSTRARTPVEISPPHPPQITAALPLVSHAPQPTRGPCSPCTPSRAPRGLLRVRGTPPLRCPRVHGGSGTEEGGEDYNSQRALRRRAGPAGPPAAQGMLGAVVPAGAAVPPPFKWRVGGPRPCPCPCPWASSRRRGGEQKPRGRCPGPAAPPAAAPTRLLLRHRQRQRPPATPGPHSRPTQPPRVAASRPAAPHAPPPAPPRRGQKRRVASVGTPLRGDARVGARLPHAPTRARVRLRAASAHPARRGPACVCPRVFAVP